MDGLAGGRCLVAVVVDLVGHQYTSPTTGEPEYHERDRPRDQAGGCSCRRADGPPGVLYQVAGRIRAAPEGATGARPRAACGREGRARAPSRRTRRPSHARRARPRRGSARGHARPPGPRRRSRRAGCGATRRAAGRHRRGRLARGPWPLRPHARFSVRRAERVAASGSGSASQSTLSASRSVGPHQLARRRAFLAALVVPGPGVLARGARGQHRQPVLAQLDRDRWRLGAAMSIRARGPRARAARPVGRAGRCGRQPSRSRSASRCAPARGDRARLTRRQDEHQTESHRQGGRGRQARARGHRAVISRRQRVV